ncbi:hypothetical protein [Corynebacterium urealyticum]|uniref:hypothetical protein n=1 Tax=Corynebacterium urealyticum TaxID=43771 RepID=UPI0021CCB5FB|nr:hypothetical protein [Corynebacterium urealyticum]
MLAGRKHMAHYDLYQALNLDRSKAPDEISAELSERLEKNELDNIGGREEVEIARAILGDPQKRTTYDSRLDDPNAPEVDVNALRQLAAADFSAGTAPAGDPAAGAGVPAGAVGVAGTAGAAGMAGAEHSQEKQGPSLGERFKEAGAKTQQQVAPAMEKTKKEFGRSSKMAILITAIATAVVMLLIFGAVSLFGGTGGDNVTGKGAPNKKIEKLLKLRDRDKTDKWIRENIHIKAQDAMIDELDLNDDYRGIDRYLGAEDPKALYTVDDQDYMRLSKKFDEDQVKDAYKNSQLKKSYTVQIGDKSGRDTGKRLGVVELEDGKLIVNFYDVGSQSWADSVEDFDVEDAISSNGSSSSSKGSFGQFWSELTKQAFGD